MNPALVTAPAVEPLTLVEAKEHLKIDHTDEDTYISSLIASARVFCERYTKLALDEQTLKWTLQSWLGDNEPASYGLESIPALRSGEKFIEVPVGPLSSVTSITTYDDDDNATVWNAANYYVASAHNRIYRRVGITWPKPGRAAEGIEIIYKAGFGANASDVPKSIRQGLLQLIAHLYEHRENVTDVPLSLVPFSVTQSFDLYRKFSL